MVLIFIMLLYLDSFLLYLAVFYAIYRAREALTRIIPDQLKDTTFSSCLKEDSATKKWLVQLLQSIGVESPFTENPVA